MENMVVLREKWIRDVIEAHQRTGGGKTMSARIRQVGRKEPDRGKKEQSDRKIAGRMGECKRKTGFPGIWLPGIG
jgi:hypothetical protein